MRLYTLIVSRLQSDTAILDTLRSSYASTNLSAEEVGAKVLERVKIMRVFDLVGVIEAVGEIREELEGKSQGNAENETVEVRTKEAVEDDRRREAPPIKKTVIADSEDEEEDEDEDEMLLNTKPTSSTHSSIASAPPNIPVPVMETDPASTAHQKHTAKEGRMAFILIDNLAHVIIPLLRKDYVQSKLPPPDS